MGEIHYLWWSLRCKWSFPTESEVCLWQVKFHQRWSCGDKKVRFPRVLLFVPLLRGSLDYARDDVFLGERHFDQVKRVEKSPKAKQGYALNELMLGIMNWLCHEFSLRSMNCPKGHCGGKSIYFFVCPCSYHKLGDLSTTLEMTVLGQLFFYKDGRPFQEILRVFSNPLNDKTSFYSVISTKWNAWRNPLRRSGTLL